MGVLLRKISGTKNLQNVAWFRMISDFSGEYLQNGWTYSKSDKYLIDHDSSRIQQKSPVNLTQKLRRSYVSNYTHLNRLFRRLYFGPCGCCAPKFLHVLENDQVLLAHVWLGIGVHWANFFKGKPEIDLKFSKCTSITLEVGRVAPQNFTTWHAARQGWKRGYSFWGAPPL